LKDEIKLSVIVPVHNAEPFIEKCLQSLMNQTLIEKEIIIVNDNSNDKSNTIIEKFHNQYANIKIANANNHGVGAARNKGIEMATGRYIAFADADDWAEPSMYEKMYHEAITQNADIVICNAYNSEGADKNLRLSLPNKIIEFKTARINEVANLMRFKYDFANWNKIYLTRLIRENYLFFSEKLKMYEDLLFNLCFWQYCNIGVVINEPLYNYRIHQGSVMNRMSLLQTSEYNNLLKEFKIICENNSWLETLTLFKKEMRRGFYYKHLPSIIDNSRQQKNTLKAKIRWLTAALKNVYPEFFDFEKNEIKGFQGLKRWLLKNKLFSIFSIVVLSKKK